MSRSRSRSIYDFYDTSDGVYGGNLNRTDLGLASGEPFQDAMPDGRCGLCSFAIALSELNRDEWNTAGLTGKLHLAFTPQSNPDAIYRALVQRLLGQSFFSNPEFVSPVDRFMVDEGMIKVADLLGINLYIYSSDRHQTEEEPTLSLLRAAPAQSPNMPTIRIGMDNSPTGRGTHYFPIPANGTVCYSYELLKSLPEDHLSQLIANLNQTLSAPGVQQERTQHEGMQLAMCYCAKYGRMTPPQRGRELQTHTQAKEGFDQAIAGINAPSHNYYNEYIDGKKHLPGYDQHNQRYRTLVTEEGVEGRVQQQLAMQEEIQILALQAVIAQEDQPEKLRAPTHKGDVGEHGLGELVKAQLWLDIEYFRQYGGDAQSLPGWDSTGDGTGQRVDQDSTRSLGVGGAVMGLDGDEDDMSVEEDDMEVDTPERRERRERLAEEEEGRIGLNGEEREERQERQEREEREEREERQEREEEYHPEDDVTEETSLLLEKGIFGERSSERGGVYQEEENKKTKKSTSKKDELIQKIMDNFAKHGGIKQGATKEEKTEIRDHVTKAVDKIGEYASKKIPSLQTAATMTEDKAKENYAAMLRAQWQLASTDKNEPKTFLQKAYQTDPTDASSSCDDLVDALIAEIKKELVEEGLFDEPPRSFTQ